MNAKVAKPLNIALVAMLAISAFDRFTSKYYTITYPAFIDFLIDNGRLIFASLLAVSLFFILIKKRKLSWIHPNYYWAPILLHIFLSIKLLVNGNNEWHISLLGSISLLVSFHVCATFSRNSQIDDFANIIGLPTTITFLLVALLQYISAGADNMSAGSRFFFFTLHPNSAGTVWGFCTVTMFYLYRIDQSHLNLAKLGLGIICIYLLYITGSRGAFISCGAGILATLFLHNKSSMQSARTLILAMITAILISIILGQQIFDLYTEHANRGNTRYDVYTDSLQSFIGNPVIGLPYYDGRPTFVENLLLSYMMSAGFIGVLLCATFYFGATAHLVMAIRRSNRNKDRKPTFFIIISIMLLISSIFEAHQIQFVTFGSFLSIFASAFLIQYNKGGVKRQVQHRFIELRNWVD
jgi:hypothetical protein